MAHQPEVSAEVSVRSNGKIYVGVEARQRLGVEYNDRVRVTFPQDDAPDVTTTGCLDSGSQFTCGVDVYRDVGGEKMSTSFETIRRDAIVERASRTWEDAHGLTENRFDGYNRLACK